MAAPVNLYPYSTQQGDAIPLEVVKPLSMTAFSFAINTAADITIPTGYNTCWLYATEDCVLRFSATNLPNSLVDGTEYSSTIFIPAQTPISVLVTPGECSLLGLGVAGKLYINNIVQWAALNQPLQTTLG